MANYSLVARRTCKCYWIGLCDMSKNMSNPWFEVFKHWAGCFRSWNWKFWGGWAFEHRLEATELHMVAKSRSLVCGNTLGKEFSLNLFTLWLSIMITWLNASDVVNNIGQSSWNRLQFCGGQKTLCENRLWSRHRLDYIVDWVVQ